MNHTLHTADGRKIRWLTPERSYPKPVLVYRPIPEKPDNTVEEQQVAYCCTAQKFFRSVNGEWEPIR
jgi:hypothetical protein